MIDEFHKEKDENSISSQTPHLSHSRINRYLHCPTQYNFYYIRNLRLKFPSASLVFGQVVHRALAQLFIEKNDPVEFFQNAWGELKEIKLTFSKKESWEKLNGSGQGLLEKFVKEELPRIGEVRAVEKKFELN